ncbi:pilus assembly protein [Lysobacter gummosus]|uniref:Pilus assembly protein PilC n=1 Tax=Lysobacter gummosus TaxID=262324 RepID=A0ABY3X9H4_9GAMM|nr:PilC/PilY family type IV pilus protein [Lysobacter gummosus]ALN92573.1 neisseria PilC beta-propeller domain protein [Lysobacter gummosus]UNP28149.1 pilus assembly protein PilC [Lysobacter gummosus]
MRTIFRLRHVPGLLAAAVLAAATWLGVHMVYLQAASNDYALAEKPLYVGGSAPPLMMLVASRDEQLFDKAYPDYTDLDGDGVVDATYNNRFDYEGYFDPFLCYAYDGSRFKAAGARNVDHKCGGAKGWSGNFLNWVTMSRLDVLRYVLYGGNRSTDSAVETVLERAHIPNDMHAWAKVYKGTDLKDYVAIAVSGTTTFCNASSGPTGAPLMRVASGSLSNWAVTEYNQCVVRDGSAGDPDRPVGTIVDFNVRVKVCDPTASEAGRERFCSRYGSSYKPTGLLQEYGESGRLRFGLVSGTYSKPRAGGVLRKNVGLFAGNGADPATCVAGDEVRLSDGTFCNQTDNGQGIVNALKRFKIVGWTGAGTDGAWNGATWGADCGNWGTSNRTDIGAGVLADPGGGTYKCSPWGNPISEMYSEALRYLSGETAATASFAENPLSDIKGARPAWVDPYGKKDATYGGGNSYCAACSIMVLSSGASSYDGDAVQEVSRLGSSAAAATKRVGDAEQISGNSFFVGSAAEPIATNLAMSHTFFCQNQAVSDLAYVRGICNEAPQREGSYLVAGLAEAAFAADLRSGNLPGKPAGIKVNATTFAVVLADGVPTAEIATSAGTIALTPYCQANPNAASKRTCQLGDTLVGKQESTGGSKHVYGRDMTASGGSFMFSWDGAPQGEANDRDFVYMLTYCIGGSCSDDTNPVNNPNYKGYDICWGSQSAVCGRDGRPAVGGDEVLVRTEMISLSTGNPVRVGFNASGSTSDALYPNVYAPQSPSGMEGQVFNLLNGGTPSASYPMDNPVNKVWNRPEVVKLKAAGQAVSALRPPLWYAAKYGASAQDLNSNGKPDWDDNGDGQPDNYLLARNPAKLKAELGKLISKAAGASPVTGGGGSGARLSAGNSFSIASSFDLRAGGNDWTGNLVANDTNLDGSVGSQRWAAATVLAGQAASGNRNIRVAMDATSIGASGTKQAAAKVRAFTEANLRSFDPAVTVRAQLGLSASDAGWIGTVTDADLVDYLRGKKNSAPLRVRSGLIGDIVNSSVEVVAAKDDFGYGAWSALGGGWKSALGESYKTFLADKRAAGVNTALVGANDGMLHAFDVADGSERFAFIPSSARERMGQLANPNYVHRYTVDGEIVSADVPTTSSGGWRTVAVAASAAGGKSVSALDLSAPAGFNDASVLWELRGSESGNPIMDDLGHVFGRPLVVPVTGATVGGAPRWVALFGNGVNSAGGAPALFVVDLNTGDVLARLKPGGSEYASRNGLFNIAAVALYNNDNVVDTVYGGDLQGNVWKFDLSATEVSSWKVAFNDAPLFSAEDHKGTTQPITGGLEVARGPGGGAVVLFGTGRYFASTDNLVPDDPPVQSFYGVYDRCIAADCVDRIAEGRAGLARRSVSEGTGSSGYVTRSIGRGGAGRDGWYLRLACGR